MNPALLMFICTLFTAAGQLLWKQGVQNFSLQHWVGLLNIFFFLGFFCYGLGFVFLLLAFRRGELTLLYPIMATSYVWVSLLSPLFFADQMNGLKWTGVLIIIISVTLLGRGAS